MDEFESRELNAILAQSACEEALARCGQRDTEGDHEVILWMDHLDAEAIYSACRRRIEGFPLPRGNGNVLSRTLAEICRGWVESMDGL